MLATTFKKSLPKTLAIAALILIAQICSDIVVAEENRNSKSIHRYEHKYEHASLAYRSPIKEGFKAAFYGGCIGLGSGLAIAGVNSAYGGEGKTNGRIVAPLLAAGIIGGAIYGIFDAKNQNDKADERESKMIDRFGRVAPTVYQTASLGTGYGLAFRWKLN